ncbi:hypothetical protein EI94DRAFT_1155224 [Lactarius quietus]|nr:hypothetical protein EI94DRAFT_1155224 [Lactarius quietus]
MIEKKNIRMVDQQTGVSEKGVQTLPPLHRADYPRKIAVFNIARLLRSKGVPIPSITYPDLYSPSALSRSRQFACPIARAAQDRRHLPLVAGRACACMCPRRLGEWTHIFDHDNDVSGFAAATSYGTRSDHLGVWVTAREAVSIAFATRVPRVYRGDIFGHDHNVERVRGRHEHKE